MHVQIEVEVGNANNINRILFAVMTRMPNPVTGKYRVVSMRLLWEPYLL